MCVKLVFVKSKKDLRGHTDLLPKVQPRVSVKVDATILEISVVSYKNIAFAQMSDYPLKIYSSTEPSVLQSQGNKG